MIAILRSVVISFLVILGLAGWAAGASAQSGQTAFGKATVEPAINDANGSTIFLLTPDKAPLPSNANARATAPLYLIAYPVTSSVNPATLNCQPNNCDHVNVLPFPSPDYGALPGSDPLCQKYNGGGACSPLSGHDHLVGAPHTGDFNIAWNVKLVVFTHAAFLDGSINTRVLTLADIQRLKTAGDLVINPTPIIFNCSIVSSTPYYNGTPLSF